MGLLSCLITSVPLERTSTITNPAMKLVKLSKLFGNYICFQGLFMFKISRNKNIQSNMLMIYHNFIITFIILKFLIQHNLFFAQEISVLIIISSNVRVFTVPGFEAHGLISYWTTFNQHYVINFQ